MHTWLYRQQIQSVLLCCTQALQAWYQDVLTAPSVSGSTAAPHKAPATPFGKLQLTTPIKITRASATAAAARSNTAADDKCPEDDVSPGGGATSPLAKLGIHTPEEKLTGRPQSDSLQVCTCYFVLRVKTLFQTLPMKNGGTCAHQRVDQ